MPGIFQFPAATTAPATTTETGIDEITDPVSGTWRQLDASAAAAVKFIELDGSVRNPNTAGFIVIDVGIGAAAAEVTLMRSDKSVAIANDTTTFHLFVPIEAASGTRVAWRPNYTGTAVFSVGYCIGERA